MMSRALEYPWIYTTQLLSWLGVFAGFFLVMSFAMATPVYVISRHPFLFGLCVCALGFCLFAQGFIRRVIDRQVAAGGEMRARADRIARGLSVVAGFVLVLLALKFLVFRTLPA
jgi:hypothetical protein